MHSSLVVDGLGHTSVGRVRRNTDLVECFLVPVAVEQEFQEAGIHVKRAKTGILEFQEGSLPRL